MLAGDERLLRKATQVPSPALPPKRHVEIPRGMLKVWDVGRHSGPRQAADSDHSPSGRLSDRLFCWSGDRSAPRAADLLRAHTRRLARCQMGLSGGAAGEALATLANRPYVTVAGHTVLLLCPPGPPPQVRPFYSGGAVHR